MLRTGLRSGRRCAPTLEDDIALTNIALDLLGQARGLYARTAELDGSGRSEDDYAFMRDEREFVNCLLVEQENGDFAMTIVRQLLCSTYPTRAVDGAHATSTDEQVAAIASKAVKESAYHRDHATDWTLRLGDGTEESHRRMESALAALWPFIAELFEVDAVTRMSSAIGLGPDPSHRSGPSGRRTSTRCSAPPLWCPESTLDAHRRTPRTAHRAVWVHGC